jgi:hypothetical protein
MTDTDFWRDTLAFVQPGWSSDWRVLAERLRGRRPSCRKPEKTGTISEAGCLYLRALCARFSSEGRRRDRHVHRLVGAGDGVRGRSGLHLRPAQRRLHEQANIEAHGKTTSTQMFAELASAGIRAGSSSSTVAFTSAICRCST